MREIKRSICLITILFFFFISLSICQEEKSRDLSLSGASTVQEVKEAPSYGYRKSWAMLIGINKYEKAPWDTRQLDYAGKDAIDLARLLQEKFGFKKENIFLLLDKDSIEKMKREGTIGSLSVEVKEASLQNIRNTFSKLLNPLEVDKEKDRVLIFFAGHGQTMDLPNGGEMGFIIPSDGGGLDLNDYDLSTLAMEEIERKSKMMPAKHVLYLVDACYSGLATVRGFEKPDYIEKVFPYTSRQIITAGRKDEPVIERGDWGHSAFTYSLLNALKTGSADLDRDGFITASELGMYLAPEVTNLTKKKQTPQNGRFLDEGGEFTFALNIPKISNTSNIVSSPNLVSKFGYITVNIIPWAEVTVDGENYGAAPLVNKRFLTGEHLITIQKGDSYKPVEKRIVVEEGKKSVVSVILERK